MTTEKLVTSVITGFAAGAIFGILFAPDRGSETRRRIAQKTTDLSDAIVNGLNSFTEAVSDKYESIKEDTAELMDKGRDKVQNFKEEEFNQPSIV